MLLLIILLCLFILSFTITHSTHAASPGRLTERARTIISYANEEAIKRGHSQVETEHILMGLIREGKGIAARVLEELGLDLEIFYVELDSLIGKTNTANPVNLEYSNTAKQALHYALEESQKAGYDHIGTEHILLGLLRVENGKAFTILSKSGITLDKVYHALEPVSSQQPPAKEKTGTEIESTFTSTQPLAETTALNDLLDASIDATEYIQKELDKLTKTGGEVFLPAGRYRLDGHLNIPSGVTLKGTWTGPHHARLRTGTVLLAYKGRGKEDNPPLISLNPGSAIQGLTIYYPEQSIEDIQPYPWTIQGRGMHNSVMDVTLVNPYKGIDFGSFHNELHYLRNVFGCPLKIGVYINNCTDIGRIENVHFNPHYWGRDEGDGEPRPNWKKLLDYLLKEGEGFIFGRTDWEYVLNTFCYGYKIGYHFIATKEGLCNGNFLGIGADGTQNSVVVDQAAPYGILITNGEFVSMNAEDPVEIIVGPENRGVLQLNNCAFWGPSNQIARIVGNGSVSFVQCNFVHWDQGKKGLPAIQANGGNVSIQSCKFHRGSKHIKLGENQRSAVILGNQTFGQMIIENESKGDVQIGFNVVN